MRVLNKGDLDPSFLNFLLGSCVSLLLLNVVDLVDNLGIDFGTCHDQKLMLHQMYDAVNVLLPRLSLLLCAGLLCLGFEHVVVPHTPLCHAVPVPGARFSAGEDWFKMC